jgi:hypothetical protein
MFYEEISLLQNLEILLLTKQVILKLTGYFE